MDGFGLRQETEGNAIRAAATPRLDQFFREYAHTTLRASGLDVGLPDGQMGNSEVGHTNIGAGRVVFQDLPRITKAIADGSFDENPAYRHAMDACLEKGTLVQRGVGKQGQRKSVAKRLSNFKMRIKEMVILL